MSKVNGLRTVYLAWQDPIGRGWFPIGCLTFDGHEYVFYYVQGAREASQSARFEALQAFPEWDAVYVSDTLFPLFANRILPKSRPDYSKFTQWMNLPDQTNDPFVLLARSGGRKKTDKLEIVPYPSLDSSGKYGIHFFVHGLSHLPQDSINRVKDLQPGERLLLMRDVQNPRDPGAFMLRTDDESRPQDVYLVGYCPKYLTREAAGLLDRSFEPVIVTVQHVNLPPAPVQWRLLCSLTADWPTDWEPFSGDEFQPIPRIVDTSSTKTS